MNENICAYWYAACLNSPFNKTYVLFIILAQKTTVSRQSSARRTARDSKYSENKYANGVTSISEQPKSITISLSEDITLSDVVTNTTSSEDPIVFTRNTSEELLTDIRNILLTVQKEREANKDVARNRTEWQLVALILDRAFLIFFVLLTVVVSLTILLNHLSYDAKDWQIR